jgi:hypothetical protein
VDILFTVEVKMIKRVLWLLACAGMVLAQVPRYDDYEVVVCNGSDVKLNIPSPGVFDWNGDGKMDLIVGEFSGRVNYFENVGSASKPEFKEKIFFEAGGEIIDFETG